jgi:peroxiredoxin
MRRESATLREGDRAPDFALADIHGVTHTLAELLEDAQRALLIFDRGTW